MNICMCVCVWIYCMFLFMLTVLSIHNNIKYTGKMLLNAQVQFEAESGLAEIIFYTLY